jgi:hypothetical protein
MLATLSEIWNAVKAARASDNARVPVPAEPSVPKETII